MRFDSIAQHVGTIETSIGDLRAYPQLLRATPAFAHDLKHEGLSRIVNFAISALRRSCEHISIDTRLSMLMPGMYPCIPGWHCDDFYRPTGGQPDLKNAPPAEHVCVILGNCSRTRFISEAVELPLPTERDLEEGRTVYGVMHRRIEQLDPATFQVASGEVWRFDQKTWHRGEPATEMGWRYFFRLTGSNHWTPLNQQRTQTQVYLTAPFAGW